ncbi:SDR family NAD(P)-dependent oxidoreductase [Photobacterium sp. SDRW27]|uniref:SDR family NAD(P)-dependent oxidoreductase n=1 Tax=Photobacterium obscurum TaxID=2829490 RepID=UPI00224447F0|nr:SDR family NAD(P)-dependent oxidoreductase [Photobacterium obscurum]MCW8328279.1 SDR family NAD(P)-dependent oxidoreductase [Photobacterium obscurum]
MNYLIFGASGGIGSALVELCLTHGHAVTAISRQHSSRLDQLAQQYPNQLATLQADVLNWQPKDSRQLEKLCTTFGKPDITFNAIGILHTPPIDSTSQSNKLKRPEKQLSQIDYGFFQHNMKVNCFSSIVIAQYLSTLYLRNEKFGFVTLSAMIGSISDNRTGGWYSYRMSKAALNMFIKTLSIEWHRTFPHAYVLAIHPGTTDTKLSAPFQQRLTSNKLFSAQQTAERILAIVEQATSEHSGNYLSWDGQPLGW